MQKPAQRILNGKAKETETKKATSPADWAAQEAAEGPARKPTGDAINDTVGRDTYMSQASFPAWISPSLKRRLTVTRLYFHPPAIIIDKPGTLDELADKAKYFSGTDIAYVGIKPGSAIEPRELAAMVDKALQGKKRPQAGAQVVKPGIPAALAKAIQPPQAITAPKASPAKKRR